MPTSIEAVSQPIKLHREPRRWQREALAAWETAGRRGVVRVVTGGGKTVFAQLCMSVFAQAVSRPRFVIVVPTHALLDQWYVSLREDLGLATGDIALFSGKGRNKSQVRLVNLVVINTARSEVVAKNGPGDGMLIVDECHRAGSTANADALRGTYSAALGLSATPEREYDRGFEERIAPVLGNVVFDYGLNEASADGVISPFSLTNVRFPLLFDEEQEYARLTRRIAMAMRTPTQSSNSSEKLRRLLRRRARVASRAALRIPATVRLVEEHRGSRCLVFHEEIPQAQAILELLTSRGHSATIYHSQMSDSMRRDNLYLFRRGIFDVLVSCRALDEGVNVPEASIAVIASASASMRQRVQRLGRVLRPAEGKTSAHIYTLYATTVEEQRLANEAKQLTSASLIRWTRIKRLSRA